MFYRVCREDLKQQDRIRLQKQNINNQPGRAKSQLRGEISLVQAKVGT